jgi:hypothetical protein
MMPPGPSAKKERWLQSLSRRDLDDLAAMHSSGIITDEDLHDAMIYGVRSGSVGGKYVPCTGIVAEIVQRGWLTSKEAREAMLEHTLGKKKPVARKRHR